MWLGLLIGVVGGAIVGGAVAWAIAASRASKAEGETSVLRDQVNKAGDDFVSQRKTLDEESRARVEAETRLAETVRNLEDQKHSLEETKKMLLDSFKGLSSDALKSNSEEFIKLAGKTFDALIAEAKGDIGKRKQAIDALIKPLGESVKELEKRAISLQEQLKTQVTSQQQLQKETGNLVTALRTPHIRGQWGQMTLRRVVELSGMSEHCDFTEEVSVNTEDGRLRPDMIVHLPAEREIVVDAKTPLDAYISAIEAVDEEERSNHLVRHARQLREKMLQLSRKAYWEQFERAPEFVVMFIPGESFVASALDSDKSLLEDGMKHRVVLATPTTLIALLQAAAYGWRQEQFAKNAEVVQNLGKELYERVKVVASHIIGLGKTIKGTNEAFNKVVGSMESRVLPSVRKFQDLGVVGGESIPVIEPIDTTQRTLSTEDITASSPDEKV